MVDKKTLSLFVLGKKNCAYACVRQFISYYSNTNNQESQEGIMHVISSKFLHGFGQQTDGTLTVEMIEKRLNMIQ